MDISNMGDEETAIEVDNEVGSVEELDDYCDFDTEEDWEYLDVDILQRLKQNDPTVTALDINYNPIDDDVIDDDAGDFDWKVEGRAFDSTNLQALHIRGNSSESETANTMDLYRAVSRNRSIRKLYLEGDNHIGTGRVMELLSSFFTHNNNLRHLVVSGVDTYDISAKTSQLLADVLSKCKSLRIFGLNMGIEVINSRKDDSDRAKDDLVSKLVTQLSDTNVRVFRLNMNTSKTKTKWCSAVGNLLQNTSKLAVLDLSSNHISNEGAALLGNGLEKNNTLKKLSLTGIKSITSAGWATFFRHLSKLEKLNLRYTDIDDGDITLLGIALVNNSTLQTLDLGYCHTVTATGWVEFFRHVSNSNLPLEELILSSINDITNEGITTLASVVSTKTKLKHLDLSHNYSIRRAGWRTFFDTMRNSNSNFPSLERISLFGNNINDDAVVSIVGAFSSLCSMKYLSLCGNSSITIVGMISIASLLRNPNSCLEQLRLGDVYDNGVNGVNIDDAVVAYARELVNNSSLKYLSFGNINVVTASGLNALSTLLCNKADINSIYTSNHTLQIVVSSRGSRELSSYLKLNRNGNKAEVARQKIIRYHFTNGEDNMQEFADMELGLLPHALGWMCRNDTGLSLLYQLVRSMPSLFDYESMRAAVRKR